jgi:hypothetical protein
MVNATSLGSRHSVSARCAGWTLALLTGVIGHGTASAQDDRVVLTNGDRLTGEIKSLERGKLSFDTPAADVISIKWEQVAQLVSKQNFEITLDDGRQFFGSLVEGTESGTVRLQTDVQSPDFRVERVVRMTPIEGRVIDRIEMSADAGYSFTKATDVAQTNVGYNLNYRSEERLMRFDLDVTTSSSEDRDDSVRSRGGFAYRRFLDNRDWDPLALAQVERNDELGLSRRRTLGGGMSTWITDTNSRRMSFFGGLVYSTEQTTDSPETDDSVEATVGLDAEWFRYETPELDVSTQFAVFQRLSGEERTRGNLDVDFRWELVKDFFWGFSIYYSFDSSTETVDASSSDYGVVTSLGWTF